MMGYTHIALGAAIALSTAVVGDDISPSVFIVATIAGEIGGIVPDIDMKDTSKITDAGRSRVASVILLGLGIGLDYFLKLGIYNEIISRGYYSIVGLVAFILLLFIGSRTPHRSFSHSALFVLITSIAFFLIYPPSLPYYFTGITLHIILDMFNKQGVYLLYPIKLGNGFALGLCKSNRIANKVFYFIGVILLISASAMYFEQIISWEQSIAPAIILVATVLILHFVRKKSEKEIRHIMHINKEL